MAVKSEDREILGNWINLEEFKVEVKLKVVYERWMDQVGSEEEMVIYEEEVKKKVGICEINFKII